MSKHSSTRVRNVRRNADAQLAMKEQPNNCKLLPYEHDRHPFEDADHYIQMCNGAPNK